LSRWLEEAGRRRRCSAHLVRESAIAAVVLATVREDKPVLEVCAR
jgi:hypothetical protein